MAATTERTSALLKEIEGMRALAVTSVLLYHAGFGLSGGYIGVDVFFVVSGFLITSLLQREFQSTGRISLSGFYARRARRLLPAATLVLITTVVLAQQMLNPVRAHQTAVDSLWSGGFLANFHFAQVGADYLQSTQPPSLVQHWWSLAVEEQFYVIWPGLLALTWFVWRRVTAAGLSICIAVTVASFAIGVYLTEHNPSWGYFASWARAWELSLGGVCAFAWGHRRRIPWGAVLGWLGMAAVVATIFVYDETTDFPGTAALVPVLGTVAVILSIGARGGPGALLSLAPLQWIGARSYGIYLWHWPLLMLLHDRQDSPSALWRGGTLVVSVAIAALSFVLLENPIRHNAALARSPRRSLAMGAATILIVLGAGVTVSRATSDITIETGYIAPTIPPTTMAPTTVPASTLPMQTTTTLPPVPWATRLQSKIDTELQPLIVASAANELLPENITPGISAQAKDAPPLWYDGCLLGFSQYAPGECNYGDVASDFTVTIFGDSHVVQWFPGLVAAALTEHWRVHVEAKKICPAVGVSVMRKDDEPYPSCDRWYGETLARIAASDTDLVIITQWRWKYDRNDNGARRSMNDGYWQAGLDNTVRTLTEAGKRVLLLGDAPMPFTQMDQCLAGSPQRITRCSVDPARVVNHAENELQRQVAAAHPGAMFYDPTSWFCTATMCPSVVGNMAVFLDTNHINNTYGTFLAPYLTLLVKEAAGVAPE